MKFASISPVWLLEENRLNVQFNASAVRNLHHRPFDDSFDHTLPCEIAKDSSRLLLVNMKNSIGPVDRYFYLPVRADLPGTLIRDDDGVVKLKRSQGGN
jgi:hypothetical protein